MARTVQTLMRPMKIVHIQTRMNRSGGAEENTWASCLHQLHSGHEVHLICGYSSDTDAYRSQQSGVHIHFVPEMIRAISPRYDIKAFGKLSGLFKRIKPDVVHTHTSKAGILGRLAAKRAGVPMIVHGVHILPFSNVGLVERTIYLGIEHAAALVTDHFIHVSEGTKTAYRQARIGRGRRHTVVRSGMDIEKFRNAPWPEDWRELLGLNDSQAKPVIILLMAVLERRKRQEEFLRGFADCTKPGDDIRLLLAGEGPEHDRLLGLITELKLDDRVKLLGHRNDPEKLVALSDLSALGSMREGLPRTIVQSIAGGRPAIVGPLQGIEEIIVSGCNGVIVPTTQAEAIAQEAVAVARDTERLACLTMGAAQDRVGDWSFRSMFAKLDEAYAESLSDPWVSRRFRPADPSHAPAGRTEQRV